MDNTDDSMNNIYNLTLTDLENYFINKNEKKFKGQQVFDWLYRKRVTSFDEMTNLKKEVIDLLKSEFTMKTLSITKVERDTDVNKYLFSFSCSIFSTSIFSPPMFYILIYFLAFFK